MILFRITFCRFSYPCAKARDASDVEESISVLCGQLLLKKTELIYYKLCLSPRLFFVCDARAYLSTLLSVNMWSVLESIKNIFQTLQSLGTKTKERNTLKSLDTYTTVTKTIKSLGTYTTVTKTIKSLGTYTTVIEIPKKNGFTGKRNYDSKVFRYIDNKTVYKGFTYIGNGD